MTTNDASTRWSRLNAADMADLRERVPDGSVLEPGDDRYDDERSGFQTYELHRPRVLVAATTAADVVAAVTFADEHDLPIGVLGTGHQPSGGAHHGMIITTSGLVSVEVDAETRRACVGAGTRWEEVVQAASVHGLVPLSGSAPHVAAVPYVLGGGLSMLGRTFGWAADHVGSFEVVCGDGVLRHVSAQEHPDLFWALRGGGGNFGVVVSMDIDLFPIPTIYGGSLFFDTADLAPALRAWFEWTRTVPESMTSSAVIVPFPDSPDLPEFLRGRTVLQIRIADAAPEAGSANVAPLREAVPPILDTVAEIPSSQIGTISGDPTDPMPGYGTSSILGDPDIPAAVDGLIATAGPDATVPCAVEIRHLGAALARPPAVDNAVGHRDMPYVVGLNSPMTSGCPHEAEVVALREAHAAIHSALAPWAISGHVLNFTGVTDEDPLCAYSPEDRDRLCAVKRTWDPKNTFRINQNISPR